MRASSWFRSVGMVLLMNWAASAANGAEPGGFADALVFDSTTKELTGQPGETTFAFTFSFTNNATVPAVIDSVRTSCGCTVARVPPLPWTVAPGERGDFSVSLDGRGKRGTVTKSVFVSSSLGLKALTVRAIVADPGPTGAPGDDRLRNMQVALADRFAVFRGDCASCHAKPAEGRMGAALYLSACGVCHDSQHRASMVPDLRKLGHPTDREHWIKWMTFGRHGSLMPAFAQSEGGILSEAQIDSVADYLSRTIDGARLSSVRKTPIGAPPQPPPLPGGASAQPLKPVLR